MRFNCGTHDHAAIDAWLDTFEGNSAHATYTTLFRVLALNQAIGLERIQYTPVAPMENPQVSLVITDFYYSGFADQLANAA